ncbi:MAG: peptidoglycan-binding protein, partial [Paracoccaceae bacterium]
SADRIGSEIAVAGYSYEDRLSAPVLTFGALEALEGLQGEQGIKRLSINVLPGDAGGPVIDGTGAVLGMLQPAPSATGRQLPPDVGYATAATVIAAQLTAAGVAPVPALPGSGALPPEDLARRALDMTVLVSCWE